MTSNLHMTEISVERTLRIERADVPVRMTMVYTHVLNRGGKGFRSLVDSL